ncbi:hypothetical protein PG993_015256 [Apiospora rasikravindrae]|uniref:Histidine-specific methyltransferase SAM-dependent domain-containing protein n=1 Tax=Apiospora rasikravindrae TaxID=990691 RepID=A0ABR1RQD7_9PEZI
MPVELCVVPNPLTLNANPGGRRPEKPPSQVDVSSVQSSTDEERHKIDIIDIRDGRQSFNLVPAIRHSLQHRNEDGHRTLPSLLLWNERGLKLFEELTYAPEYYLTNTEIALLEAHSREIAQTIEPGTILLELGSGNLRKIRILLQAIEALGKRVDYYALDLDRNELERTLNQLRTDAGRFRHVRCHGLHGTYDDGQVWIARPENARRPRCVLSLGSTLGSFAPSEAAAFLKMWTDTLQADGGGAAGSFILGLDGCKDGQRVFAAYNDPGGANRRFILNALDSANAHLGHGAFRASDWTVRGEWVDDDDKAKKRRHVQYLAPLKRDVQVTFLHEQHQKPITVRVQKDETVELVSSYKFDEADKERLWEESGLRVASQFFSKDGSYGVCALFSTDRYCNRKPLCLLY